MLKISNLRYEILRDVIISDFSLRLRAGEVKTLFGPSGCGKTSLLRLVCGLEDKKSGQIENGFKKISFLFPVYFLFLHKMGKSTNVTEEEKK